MRLSYNIIKKEKYKDNGNDNYQVPIIIDGKDIVIKKKSKPKVSEYENSEDILKSQEIINEAMREREEILNRTNEEKDKILEEAKKSGFDEGFKKGHSQGQKQGYSDGYNESLNTIENAKQVLKNSKVESLKYIESIEEDILKLSVDIARNITKLIIDESQDKIINMVKSAIEEFKNEDLIIIRCHPSSKTYLENNIEKLEEVSPNSKFTLLEDKCLEENGCFIEGEVKTLDIQISTQIENIYNELKKMRDDNV